MSGAPVGKDKKSGSRTSAPKGAGRFQMPRGGFRSPEGEGRGQVVRVLEIGDGYAGCRQTRAVEEERMRGVSGRRAAATSALGAWDGR